MKASTTPQNGFSWTPGFTAAWAVYLFWAIADLSHENNVPVVPRNVRLIQITTPAVSVLLCFLLLRRTRTRRFGALAYLVLFLQSLLSLACPTWW
jgi:hypothetical protein